MPRAGNDRPPTARLFVGLWPDAGVRERLGELQRNWCWPPGAALTRPERLHMTLHFLGAVERARVPALLRALELARRVERIELLLDASELWPGGIAVVRPTVVPAALLELHARLGDALDACGQPSARPDLKPHVTLARHAQAAVPAVPTPAIPWTIEGYALIESRLGRWPQYLSLRHYP